MRRKMQWLLLLLFALAVPLFLVSSNRTPAPRDFDSATWEDHLSLYDGGRQGMAAKFIVDGALIGKTRAEQVIAMLCPIGTWPTGLVRTNAC